MMKLSEIGDEFWKNSGVINATNSQKLSVLRTFYPKSIPICHFLLIYDFIPQNIKLFALLCNSECRKYFKWVTK